jgi:hypothetical protein
LKESICFASLLLFCVEADQWFPDKGRIFLWNSMRLAQLAWPGLFMDNPGPALIYNGLLIPTFNSASALNAKNRKLKQATEG